MIYIPTLQQIAPKNKIGAELRVKINNGRQSDCEKIFNK
jgi:hypothetical protein